MSAATDENIAHHPRASELPFPLCNSLQAPPDLPPHTPRILCMHCLNIGVSCKAPPE